MSKLYFDSILSHYEECWGSTPNIYLWDKGPFEKLPFDFRVLEFAPRQSRAMWTYATCYMSDLNSDRPIELHLFSEKQDDSIIELLATITYYHRKTNNLDLNHTVNLGRPWQKGSNCDYGLISLPYLDGPALEDLILENQVIKFYWLIPITKKEVEYKKKYGIEALEKKFDEGSLNYINIIRKSLV